MRKCSYCGNKIGKEAANFCSNCGNSLNSTFNKTLYVKQVNIMHYPDLVVVNGSVIYPKFPSPSKLIVRVSQGVAQYYINGEMFKKDKVKIDPDSKSSILVGLNLVEQEDSTY